MFRCKTLLLGACLALMACQGDPKSGSDASIGGTADIELRATSDLTAPTPIVRASFVPNNVASWLGHIIMADDQGNLHRASTDGKVIPVKEGRYTDVTGLNRPNKAGAFLALTKSGDLRAFIEADNDGNFKPISLSQVDASISAFCPTAEAYEDTIWARSKSGQPIALAVEFFDEASVTLTQLVDADVSGACQPLAAEQGGPVLSTSKGSPYLRFGEMEAEMVNGLSIAGLTTPGYVTITNENMGSVFADGLLIAADSQTGRLVLIARSYLISALKDDR